MTETVACLTRRCGADGGVVVPVFHPREIGGGVRSSGNPDACDQDLKSRVRLGGEDVFLQPTCDLDDLADPGDGVRQTQASGRGLRPSGDPSGWDPGKFDRLTLDQRGMEALDSLLHCPSSRWEIHPPMTPTNPTVAITLAGICAGGIPKWVFLPQFWIQTRMRRESRHAS